MFAGHIGIALAATRLEPRINLGVFAAAALLLDIVLWSLILLGWETVVIPGDFAQTHQPAFVFPFSHGLLAGVLWSAMAAALAFLLSKDLGAGRSRAALLVAAVVFSHWVLDALVHRPEMPLAGPASAHVGLGLWNAMPVALAVEAALVLAGMALFFRRRSMPRLKMVALAAFIVLALGFTIAGMTVAPPPPSAAAMAASSLATIVLACLLMGWLAKGSRA